MSLKASDIDKLHEAVAVCRLHEQKMRYALTQLQQVFPLTIETYLQLEPVQLSFFDQLILRFSKLQDCMGTKLFSSLLSILGEDYKNKAFIDILNRLEQLQYIQSTQEWLLLRETRNIFTNEYPYINQDIIDGLNILHVHSTLLLSIWLNLEERITNKFH